MTNRRIRRTRKGDFELRIPEHERELLRSLAPQVREVLGTDDPAAARLFPPAYRDDPEAAAEYRRLVGDQLMSAHLAALETLESTVDAARVGEEQLLAWMRALNQVRLLLGARLEITQDGDERPDPDDPRAGAYAVYDYLTWLQDQAIAALS